MALRTLETHQIEFFRPSTPRFESGEYIPTAPTSIGVISGSLQPYVQGSRYGEIVKMLPQGLDTQSMYFFLTKTELRAASRTEGHRNDFCELPDGVYEAYQTSNWNIPGFATTSHYMFILVKRPDLVS